VDTRDHEDHTFCGVMFDCHCETNLPAKYVEIQEVKVRGDLGPVTVWTTADTWEGKHEEESAWRKVYQGQHEPTARPRRGQPATYTTLKLTESIRLHPGESCGMYVHSALPGDEGLVYDNAKGPVTYQDKVFKVVPGVAHLSNKPFGSRGMWGRPWRQNREFVGRIEYGVRWRMWSPEVHRTFPTGFQKAVMTMVMASRRPESLLYSLQDEIILFIMNKCSWDWWGDASEGRTDAAAQSSGASSRAVGPSRGGYSGSGGYGGGYANYHPYSGRGSALLEALYFHQHGLGAGGAFDAESDDDDYEEYEEFQGGEEEDDEEEEDDDDDDDDDEGEGEQAAATEGAAQDID